jgi:hypothetical protein
MKFSLIDLDAEMQTGRKVSSSHRERLSERTPRTGDAIVCSASNYTKMQKLAEMTSSFPETGRVTTKWISAIRTGIGPFVAPCWIAAAVYDEDYKTGYKTNIVRNYLLNWEQKSGMGKFVVGLYRLHGEAVAEIVKKSSILKRGFKAIFDKVFVKATA